MTRRNPRPEDYEDLDFSALEPPMDWHKGMAEVWDMWIADSTGFVGIRHEHSENAKKLIEKHPEHWARLIP